MSENEYEVADEKSDDQENENDLRPLDPTTISEAVLWSTDWTTETILKQMIRGNIELNPKFQRRDAWTNERKSRFIESLILGLPIPPIILAEAKGRKGSYIVIDGKQRLLSIRQFCAGQNESERNGFKELRLKKIGIRALEGKNYGELKSDPFLDDFFRSFDTQAIRTLVIKNWPDESFLYTIYFRLNAGSLPLSPQELRQALHPGKFLDFVDEYTLENNALRGILGIKGPDRRMKDTELLLRFYAFLNFVDIYAGNYKEFLDTACQTLNDEWEDREEEITMQLKELEAVIAATIEIFGEREAFSVAKIRGLFSNVFNRAVFDIMAYYFSDPEVRGRALIGKEKVKSKFIKLCIEDKEFVNSIGKSTKDLSSVVTRFSRWGESISDLLDIEVLIPVVESGKIVLRETILKSAVTAV
ncbi:MAG: DUF262 domain-containing protein [Nitrospirae bacterium]|nr:DUF262 domain-containing protein [Nitrospirota bacterium]